MTPQDTEALQRKSLELSKTDRNGNPLVGKILDIIDDKRSRYAVAVAIAEFIATHEQEVHERYYKEALYDVGYSASLNIPSVDSKLAELQAKKGKTNS